MKSKFKKQNDLALIARLKKGITENDKIIIQLILQELTSEEIAVKLGKSKRTIENARLMIIKIIGCKNVVGVVKYAVKKGMV